MSSIRAHVEFLRFLQFPRFLAVNYINILRILRKTDKKISRILWSPCTSDSYRRRMTSLAESEGTIVEIIIIHFASFSVPMKT